MAELVLSNEPDVKAKSNIGSMPFGGPSVESGRDVTKIAATQQNRCQ
jgi:hypothetical protein